MARLLIHSLSMKLLINGWVIVGVFASILINACPALALPVGAQALPSSQMFQMNQNGRTYTCGMVNSVWHGGMLVSGRFISFAQLITNTKVKMKTAAPAKKAAMKIKLASYKKSHTVVGAICRAAANSNNNPPTSTPRPTPNTATNFDSSGNVTAAGKTLFAIPSSLSANKDRGKTVWDGECRACHSSEYRNKRYTDLVNLLPGAPMYIHLQSSELADLVAYLNRFR